MNRRVIANERPPRLAASGRTTVRDHVVADGVAGVVDGALRGEFLGDLVLATLGVIA